jgi:hypothetical protein
MISPGAEPRASEKLFIVKRLSDGRFLGFFGKWHAEYPDAQEFGSLRQAEAAARKTKVVMCAIWESYGNADERVVKTVTP